MMSKAQISNKDFFKIFFIEKRDFKLVLKEFKKHKTLNLPITCLSLKKSSYMNLTLSFAKKNPCGTKSLDLIGSLNGKETPNIFIWLLLQKEENLEYVC